ncbi:unnamed protein product [Prunus brigantina]
MRKSICMELGVLNSLGSLPHSIDIECRFRFQSAFDPFCIASEAFYERRRLLTRSTAIAPIS